jgi:hypothetical protein
MGIIHTYVVEGRGEFPTDMLRRDNSAFHNATEGLYALQASKRRTVKLETPVLPKFWTPLVGRWESFGWKVIEHNGVAFPYSSLPAPTGPSQDSPEYTEAFEAMKAALRNIIECAEAGSDGANMDLWIDQAKAAIAKAEGRIP